MKNSYLITLVLILITAIVLGNFKTSENFQEAIGTTPGQTTSNPNTLTKDNFDWQTYVSIHPDLQRAGINTLDKAWNHYVSNGKSEGRKAGQKTSTPMRVQTTGAPMIPQTTGAPMITQTTKAQTPGQTTKASMITQTTKAQTPGQTTGAPMITQTTKAPMITQTTGAPMITQTTKAQTPGQTTGAPMKMMSTLTSTPMRPSTTGAPQIFEKQVILTDLKDIRFELDGFTKRVDNVIKNVKDMDIENKNHRDEVRQHLRLDLIEPLNKMHQTLIKDFRGLHN